MTKLLATFLFLICTSLSILADGLIGEIQSISIYPNSAGTELCVVKMDNDSRIWAFELGSISAGVVMAKLIKAHEQNQIIQIMWNGTKLINIPSAPGAITNIDAWHIEGFSTDPTGPNPITIYTTEMLN